MLYHYFTKPVRLDYLHLWLKKAGTKVLDIGCGNHSPTLTKAYYPHCRYYGLDTSRTYGLDGNDFRNMEEFYEIDLSKPAGLNRLPDEFFDCVILSHVIEHLENGEEIIIGLLKKMKTGGIVYVESPSPRSLVLPYMKGSGFSGTLNFYDDPSHVKIYERSAVEWLLQENHCTIVNSGIRRSWKRILFFPLYFLGSLIVYRSIIGGIFWDLTGFAYFIIAKKRQRKSHV